MSVALPTPGPWHVDGLAVFCANGSLVAEAHEDYFTFTEVDQANARLIAAAPDLLKALQAIVELDDGDVPAMWPFQADFEAARAAIAKATGGAK